MFASMHEYRDSFLHLLVINRGAQLDLGLQNVKLYSLEDLQRHPIRGREVSNIVGKHGIWTADRPSNIHHQDYLRWALKPVFANILLERHDHIFYCDCDLYFYQDWQFLVDECKPYSMALSPHWRTIYQTTNQEWKYNFEHGFYNGGFFSVTKSARPILDWWSDSCLTECSASSKTTYVDQRYLDAVPIYFDNIHIIKHKGCNVAAWNHTYLTREVVDGQVLVNGDPIIFIHYSPVTKRTIETCIDDHLSHHYEQYQKSLLETRSYLTDCNQAAMISQINPNLVWNSTTAQTTPSTFFVSYADLAPIGTAKCSVEKESDSHKNTIFHMN